MNSVQFEKIVDRACERIKSTLIKKRNEYSGDDNVFHNFERAAAISGNSPEKVLWMFALKHYTSLSDIIDKIDKEGVYPSREVFLEKETDLLNYLILLEGLIYEKAHI